LAWSKLGADIGRQIRFVSELQLMFWILTTMRWSLALSQQVNSTMGVNTTAKFEIQLA
jgi:hypothetical protein